MATQHLDLEEQEQLDQIKAFWRKWGNAITWLLIVVLGSYAAYNGWQLWQSSRAQKAAAIYDQVTEAAGAGNLTRLQRVLTDFRNEADGTLLLQHGELALAKVAVDKGDLTVAAAALNRVIADGTDEGLTAIAKLRLAGVFMQEAAWDKAKGLLGGTWAPEFEGLVADRLGDIALATDDTAGAIAAYQKAWSALGRDLPYRRLIEVKLNALGSTGETAPEGK